jgi:hypothetical protein
MSRSLQSSGELLAMRLGKGVYDSRWIVVLLGGSKRYLPCPYPRHHSGWIGVIKLGRKMLRDHRCRCVSAERDDLMQAMARCGGLVRFAAVLVELNERR